MSTIHQRQFGYSRRDKRQMKSPTRSLTPKDLPAKGINYHPNHLRLLWQSGKFPPPTHLSPRKIAWPEEVIDRWMHSKITGAA